MFRIRLSVILIITTLISCKNNDVTQELNKIQIFDNEEKISTLFYLNNKMQKDSIEEIYDSGVLIKKIFWKKGVIQSVNNFDKTNLNNIFLKDSIFITYDDNKKMLQKFTLNSQGLLHGKSIKYNDSKITEISNYADGKIKGLVIHFNENEYPDLIGDLIDNSFHFGIKFHESTGKLKSLRVNDSKSKLGIIYNYYPSGQIKNKVELNNGKINGIQYKFNKVGDTLSKYQYRNGLIDRSSG